MNEYSLVDEEAASDDPQAKHRKRSVLHHVLRFVNRKRNKSILVGMVIGIVLMAIVLRYVTWLQRYVRPSRQIPFPPGASDQACIAETNQILLQNQSISCLSPVDQYCYIRYIVVRMPFGQIISMYNPSTAIPVLFAREQSFLETHPILCPKGTEVLKIRWSNVRVTYHTKDGVERTTTLSADAAGCVQHYLELMDDKWSCF